MRLPLAIFLLTFASTQFGSPAHCSAKAAQRTGAEIPKPGAADIGDTIQPSAGNGGYEVHHYWLDMRFSTDLTTYTATSTLNARTTQALSRFNLDLKGNHVNEVTVDGRPAKWAQVGEELQVTPPSFLPHGANFQVRVQVSGDVPNVEQAHQISSIVLSLVRDGDWVQTVNQPTGAHRFAALADHPSQKAPATITIIAPSRLNSIANGELTGTWQDSKDSSCTVRRFESRQKLATELIQIGVGPFSVIRRDGPHGIKLRYALPTDQLKTLEPQLATVPAAIQFLEERLGPFPLNTYGLFVTPLGGDLETQSLAILSTKELSPDSFKAREEDGVIAHEVSHEYFGNSVSPHRWSDVWLNEGHASYYEYLWEEVQTGRSSENNLHRQYMQMNRLLQRYGPVAAPRRHAFRDPNLCPYSGLPYVGGALTLYALRQEVGATTFEHIERAWVHDYRDSVAGTDDFIALASRISGRDLKPFLRSWLYGDHVPPMPGHPDWQSQMNQSVSPILPMA